MSRWIAGFVVCNALWVGCVAESSMTGDPPVKPGEGVCQAGTDCCKPEELVCSGNPDGTLVCTCYKSWTCDDVLTPEKCTQSPATPDGTGGWLCQVYQGMERCVKPGTQAPPGKNNWTCSVVNGSVECVRPTNTPDGGGSWNCSYTNEFKVCTKGVTPGSDAGVPKTDGKVPPKTDTGVPKTDTGLPKTDTGVPTGWNCWKDAVGDTVCEKPGTGYPPGGGSWKCYWKGGTITCEGSSPTPPGGGGWTCTDNDLVGGFRCTKPVVPGDTPGGGGSWNCTSGSGQGGTTCVQPPPKKPGAECIPNQKMWCDGEVYCGYGQVVCAPDGKWKTKIDSNGKVILDCQELPNGARPNTVCACYFFYFNSDCCETPDCIVPPNSNGQICPASKGAFCDYCNPQKSECQAAGAKCVVTPKSETFCGQDCTGGKACPAGSMCTQVQSGGSSFWQCIPADQSCYY
jgi:hypothetical protein